MMLKLLLQAIYNLNKFSALIPKISCIANSHVLTSGSVHIHKTTYCLQMLASVLVGH